MNDSSDTSQSIYPFILLVLLSAVAIFDARTPLETLRPEQPEYAAKSYDSKDRSLEIEQRIWEDPFSDEVFQSGKRHETDISDIIDLTGRVLLMPVGLSDKMRAKDRENRIRRRYAIHQALSQAGYRAISPNSIYSMRALAESKEGDTAKANYYTVAIETFEIDRLSPRWYQQDKLEIKGDTAASVRFGGTPFQNHRYDNVVVAYIKSGDMKGSPLSHFKILSSELKKELIPNGLPVDVRAIGPADSGQVYKLLQDLNRKSRRYLKGEKGNGKKDARAFMHLIDEVGSGSEIDWHDSGDSKKTPYYVFSPFATSDFETMLGQRAGGKGSDGGFVPKRALEAREHEKKLAIARDLVEKLTGGRYIRTIHNDSRVFEEITRELELRQIIKCVDDLRRVALITESDTRYGRSMPVNFLKGAIEALNTEGGCKLNHDISDDFFSARMRELRVFSYISGIDGDNRRLAETDGGSSGLESGGIEKVNTDHMAMNVENWKDPIAHGHHQIDYVRRLADEIKRQSREDRPIRAIGILGTDVYDKLLLMRALKPLLGEVVFFTTDIDVRLWSSSEIPFTRNLLVGSSYGLGFAPESLQFVPPFRDSFQASTFMSVLMAVNALKHPFEIENYQPLVYEIGSEGAIYLRGGNYSGADKKVVEKKNLFSIEKPRYKTRVSVLWFITFLVISATIWLSSLASNRFYVARNNENKERLGAYKKLYLIVGIAFLAGAFLIFYIPSEDIEPIGLPDGISAWPSFYFNVFNAVLAICFCAYIGSTRHEATVRALKKYSCRIDAPGNEKNKQIRSGIIEFGVFSLFALIYGATIAFGAENGNLRGWWILYWLCPIAVAVIWIIWFGLKGIRKYNESLAKGEFPDFIGDQGHCRTVAFPLFLFMVLTISWALASGYNYLPIRGEILYHAFGISQLLQATTMLTLLSYVVYESLRVAVVVLGLSKRVEGGDIVWDPSRILEGHKETEGAVSRDSELPLAAKCVGFTSKLTEVPNRYLIYPFIVLLISFIGQSTDFEGWAWTQFRLTASGCLFAACLIPAALMRVSALRLRQRVLRAIEDVEAVNLYQKEIGEKGEGAVDLSTQLGAIRRGAYAPFFNQPIVLAILTPLGGLGSIALLKLLVSGLS